MLQTGNVRATLSPMPSSSLTRITSSMSLYTPGALLGDGSAGPRFHVDLLAVFEVVLHVLAPELLFRLRPAHQPAGAVGGGAEGDAHRLVAAAEHVRPGAHAAGDDHGLGPTSR